MATYRWAYPSDWAEERVSDLVAAEDVAGLAFMLREALARMDSDDIQDTWENDMIEAGYFEPLTEGVKS